MILSLGAFNKSVEYQKFELDTVQLFRVLSIFMVSFYITVAYYSVPKVVDQGLIYFVGEDMMELDILMILSLLQTCLMNVH